jgi:HSP20 family protein
MWTRVRDFDSSFSLFDELRRQIDRVWDDFETAPRSAWPAVWEPSSLAANAGPPVNVFDDGRTFVIQAEVPGLREKDLSITLQDGQLVVAGSLKTPVPEGYTVHRRERGERTFSRTFTLPTKVDAEKTPATLTDGILTVTLAKAEDARPRQIAIRAQAP